LAEPRCENQFSGLVATAAISPLAAIPTATAHTAAAVFPPRTPAPAPPTAAGRTFFARACDIDRQGAAIEFLAMQLVDRLLGFFGAAHGDERKPPGATRHAIHHDVGLHNRAAAGERVLEIVFSGFEGKVSNKQLCAHVMLLSETNFADSTLFPTTGFQIITEPSSLEDLPCRGSDKPSIRRADFDKSFIKFKRYLAEIFR
jgi:hypothetical protein